MSASPDDFAALMAKADPAAQPLSSSLPTPLLLVRTLLLRALRRRGITRPMLVRALVVTLAVAIVSASIVWRDLR